MAASRAGVFVAVVLLGTGVLARAGEAQHVVAGVRLAPPACPIAPLSLPAFVESLRVELAGRAAPRDTTLVTLAIVPCDTATTHVQVTVADAATGRGSARDIGLEDVALDARPRALALVVAELVRDALPPPAPSEAAPAATETAPANAAEIPTLLSLDAHALLGLFPARETDLWGGRISVAGLRPRWQAGLFAELLVGERSFSEGTVSLQSLAIGAFAGPRWTSDRVSFSPAIVGTLGWSRVEGHARTLDVVAGAGSAPTAAVRARLAGGLLVDRALSLSVLVEAGYVLRAFDATVDGVPAAGVSGATIVLGMGLAFGS